MLRQLRFWPVLLWLGTAVFLLAVVSPVAADGGWTAYYWNNRALTGDPVWSRTEAAINYDWGYGSPGGPVAADNFSARWTTTIDVPTNTYRFTATMDDGMRVWVDDVLIIDRSDIGPARTVSADKWLAAGRHALRVEYYEATGLAVARFSWAPVGGPAGPPPGPIYGSGDRPTALVNAYRLNVRTGPGINYGVMATVARDQRVELGDYRNAAGDWVQVVLTTGQTGWVKASLLTTSFPIQTLPVWAGQPAPPPPSSSLPPAYVTAFFLNVRQGPGVGYPVIATLSNGQSVGLTGYRNAAATWIQVVIPGGRQGWVNASYLASNFNFRNLAVWTASTPPAPPSSSEPPPPAPTAVVNTGRLNMRTGPGVQYALVGTINQGAVVELAGYRNAAATWVLIRLPSGVQGWVNASYIQTNYPLSRLAIGFN